MKLNQAYIDGAQKILEQYKLQDPDTLTHTISAIHELNTAAVIEQNQPMSHEEQMGLRLTSIAFTVFAGELAKLIQSGTAPAQESASAVNENQNTK
ncbi:MAG: hypothetical protein E6R03_07595 [Hyphomicrobiaceae bacterium]|nr:MAG: hypothetical protein E6R03_07595 [Hyphomicrobiaceae bacterium]